MGAPTTIRSLTDLLIPGLVAEWNKSFRDLLMLKAGTSFHFTTRTALSTVPAATATCITFATEAKAALNLHFASEVDATTGQGEHLDADATNTITGTASTIDTACTQLRLIKSKYNTHRSQAGVHPTNDGTNAVSAADCYSYDGLVALTNQEYTKYNAHLTQAGKHVANDTTNAASSSAASDLATSLTRLNDIAAKYTLHLAQTDDADIVALVNDEYTQYNAHLTQAGVHVANDTTNAASSSSASNLATALTRVNDLATKYGLHLVQTDDADIVALVNDLYTQYGAHRVYTTGSVHLNADGTNVESSSTATNLATAITRVNDLVTKYIAHCAQVGTGGSQVHLAADTVNNSFASTNPATDRAECVALLNELKTKFLAHENSVVAHTLADGTNLVTADVCVGHTHKVDDATNTITATAPATDRATCVALLNNIKTVYTAHIASTTHHKAADATNVITAANAVGHCHKVDDAVDVITVTNPATDLTEGIALANELKTIYNTHLASTTYHVAADATNPVTVAAATEYGTAVTLAADIKTQVNAHFASGMAEAPIVAGAV